MTAQIRISIRSMLLATLGVGAVCAMIVQIPHETNFWPFVTIVGALAIPAASIGYDVLPTRRGLLVGALIGLFLGLLMFLWLSRPVIRE